MCRKVISLVNVILLLGLVVPALATDYYVSPSGDDGNSGTSPSEAWATTGKVNSVSFSAGDSILFEGGQSFTGGLNFDAADAGTASNPVTVGSYSSGRATINSAEMEPGLYAYNCGGFDVQDLIVVGFDVNDPDSGNGIYFETDLSTALEHIYIDNVDVSKYRQAGIKIGKYGVNSTFRDVSITNCVIHDNRDTGIGVSGEWKSWTHENIYIADCEVYNNRGIAATGGHSGTGIVLSQVSTATIEFCESYNNGEFCDSEEGGPVGIWAWDADSTILQFSESHHNKSVYKDGGGFDLDGGCINCYMQYNYAHDNRGPAYMICQFTRSNPLQNNHCRYNIGQNNQFGIGLYSGSSGMNNNYVYGNTFYQDSNPVIDILTWRGGKLNYVALHNNIFICGTDFVDAPDTSDITLQGNLYWNVGGAPFFIDGYSDFDSWVAGTGQEKIGDTVVGMYADPCLVDAGGGGTIGNPHFLSSLTEYQLLETSPAIDAGVDLVSEFGLDPGTRDYYGTSIPQPSSGAYDMGAHEYDVNEQPDTTPPSPNPMTWESVPHAISDDSISMTATEAFDESGGVEYYFDCTAGGGNDSGWQADTGYTDSGLNPDTAYTYRVQARDISPNQNETAWSTEETATTFPSDTTPPSPDPMTWATVPYATGSTSITMEATTATDDSGVEYYFECTAGGGNDSGWQDDTGYEDTGLSPETQYTYRVQARDKSSNQNATAWSTSESATTSAGAGDLPYFDGFESGDFVAGGWTTSPVAEVKAQAKYSGSYGAELQLTGSMEAAINTSGSTDIRVRYVYRTKGLDGGEFLYVEWYDGSGWNLLDRGKEGDWTSMDIACGPGADDNPSFKLRFRLTASHAIEEYARIDDVEVTGGGPTPTPTPTQTPTPTPTPTPTTEIYVYDIAMSSYEPKANYYAARATVWIKDVSLTDISEATVTGDWSGATSETGAQGDTSQDGKVTIESKAVKGGGTFTFTVTDVSATGYTYNSSLNVMDSNSITAP